MIKGLFKSLLIILVTWLSSKLVLHTTTLNVFHSINKIFPLPFLRLIQQVIHLNLCISFVYMDYGGLYVEN